MSKAASSIAKAARMRIIALPLTSEASNSGLHTYYHFQTPPPAKPKSDKSILKKATEKTAELWAAFGKAPEGSWKHRTFTLGERIMDRIEFEELSLKSMDPSLGPKLSKFGRSSVRLEEKGATPIPLIYPSFYERKTPPLLHLRSLLEKRTPKHQKGFYLWLLASPLTAPFILVPIIPNLPGFFCLWRSWHHYRAYKASSYLEGLVDKGAIHPESNAVLDKIYEEHQPASPSSSESSSGPNSKPPPDEDNGEERIVLSREAVPKVVGLFELPPSAASDLYRALDQTEHRLRKAQAQAQS
ncbi:hypothetical protein ACEPAF_9600 [Sanghuangporus sanghuang]|uniref:Mitochondrial K+-H+ exchange-related-domain-containing protein n=1 Tax=Sanghuangporus baumii TaxID=108892 RepID=A0A9Q5NCV6_SANBA|nr:hypothetical protein A7U60_g3742 [Sanghuangporus baumii]